MDLPPQPSPTAIEVTCEDDPLTLEWDLRFPFLLRWLAALLRRRPATARLVLRTDAVIWVQARGRPPRVLARHEIPGIRPLPPSLRVDEHGRTETLRLDTGLGRADAAWLGEVLRLWHAGG